MRLTDEQIRTELRALRPTPSDRFASELDRRVTAGFPRNGSAGYDAGSRATASRASLRTLNRRLTSRRRWLPVAGAAATALVVVGIALTQVGDRDGGTGPDATLEAPADSGPSPSDQGARQAQPGVAPESRPQAAPDAEAQSVAPAPTTIPPGPAPTDERLKPGRERIQERSASMTLSTDPDKVTEVADDVVEVADRYDGIVVSSDVSSSAGKGRASFDLRIPTQNLRAALADLSGLASVASRDEGTLDITSPFVSAEERYEDAKAGVEALLEQLSSASSATEIASVREQLRLARGELAAARSELGALKQRADFSRLGLTVVGNGDADGWTLGDAADDAASVLETLGGAALVTLAALVPLGALCLLAWFVFTRLRRRRRENALDRGSRSD